MPDSLNQADTVAFPAYKDAYCYALEAAAILKSFSENEVVTNQFEGIAGLMKRLADAVHEAMHATDDVTRGQVCNELEAMRLLIETAYEEHDHSLLYATETLICLAIAFLENQPWSNDATAPAERSH